MLASAANRHTWRWARLLAEAGVDVHVLSDVPARADLDFGTIPVVQPRWTFLLNLYVFKIRGGPYANNREKWRVYRPLLRALRPDVLHAQEALAYGPTLARFPEIPRVLTPWGPEMERLAEEPGSEASGLVRQACAAADVISTNAPGLEDHWARLTGVSPDRFNLFSWGVDTEVFKPRRPEECSAVRARLGLPLEAPLVLSPRLAKPYYNIDVLLRGWQEAVARPDETFLKEAHFVVLRAGADDASWEALQPLGRPRVHFVEQRLSADEMAALYTTSTATAMLPKTDLLSMSLLEALACGSIPLIPDQPCNRTAVLDARETFRPELAMGFHIAPPDAESVAIALRRLARLAPGERARMAKHNAAIAFQHHDARAKALRMVRIYEGLRRPAP